MSADRLEPSLPQFEADQWDFPDELTKAGYVAAVDELREAMRSLGVRSIGAYLTGPPTAVGVRAITRSVITAMNTMKPTPTPTDTEPVTNAHPRRWWRTKP